MKLELLVLNFKIDFLFLLSRPKTRGCACTWQHTTTDLHLTLNPLPPPSSWECASNNT